MTEETRTEVQETTSTQETTIPTQNTSTSASTSTETTQASTAKVFTMSEIATHNTDGDCYAVISGIVYDLTAWVHKHPGGDRNILRICGMDGTSAYMGQHGGDKRALAILEGFEIGTME